MKSILMILAPENFRDMEYIVPRAFWEQEGVEVVTASIDDVSTGRYGYQVDNDYLIEEVSVDNHDGVFLVGGIGALDLQDDETVEDLVKEFAAAEKLVSAICAAPRNLLHWGILEGKEFTGHNWDGMMREMAGEHGAEWIDTSVVVDENIVTGYGPEAAEETALAVLDNL